MTSFDGGDFRPASAQEVAAVLTAPDPVAAVEEKLSYVSQFETLIESERKKWQQAAGLAAALASRNGDENGATQSRPGDDQKRPVVVTHADRAEDDDAASIVGDDDIAHSSPAEVQAGGSVPGIEGEADQDADREGIEEPEGTSADREPRTSMLGESRLEQVEKPKTRREAILAVMREDPSRIWKVSVLVEELIGRGWVGQSKYESHRTVKLLGDLLLRGLVVRREKGYYQLAPPDEGR